MPSHACRTGIDGDHHMRRADARASNSNRNSPTTRKTSPARTLIARLVGPHGSRLGGGRSLLPSPAGGWKAPSFPPPRAPAKTTRQASPPWRTCERLQAMRFVTCAEQTTVQGTPLANHACSCTESELRPQALGPHGLKETSFSAGGPACRSLPASPVPAT